MILRSILHVQYTVETATFFDRAHSITAQNEKEPDRRLIIETRIQTNSRRRGHPIVDNRPNCHRLHSFNTTSNQGDIGDNSMHFASLCFVFADGLLVIVALGDHARTFRDCVRRYQ